MNVLCVYEYLVTYMHVKASKTMEGLVVLFLMVLTPQKRSKI
jgi:hypothetical protein